MKQKFKLINDQLYVKLGDRLYGQLEYQISRQLKDQLYVKLWNPLKGQLKAQLKYQIGGVIRDEAEV